MTRPESTPGSAESRDELRLRHLLESSMAGVEPDDRLNQILQRTKVTTMSTRRSWMFGAGGAALATAAVLTAVAMIGNPLDNTAEPGPVGPPSTNATSPSTIVDPSESPSETGTPSGGTVPVYYVGDTPDGPRLYREFDANTDSTDPVMAAVSAAAAGTALDPDYRSAWPQDTTVLSVDTTPDLITIDLTGNLHDRPAGMTQEVAGLALQQLIYTAQAAYGEGRVPVQFLLDGGHTDQLLGEPASEGLSEAPQLDVLALVNISDPSEGQHVSGTLHVTGVAATFEANVPWRIEQDGTVVASNFFMAAEGGKLTPFEGDIDVSELAPGEYTLVCQEDDPSGGAEGAGPSSDTRTIVIE